LGNVLVPVDFSAESKQALQYATELGRSISLIHVVPPITFRADYGYGPVLRHVPDKAGLRRGQTKLNCWADKCLTPRRRGECLVRSGIPFTEIAAAARMAKSDLIILGVRDHLHCDNSTLGGTPEKVLRHAPCPVLVVHRHNGKRAF
jgi:nucleotide-binding universal stress UspA family protein